MEKNNAQFISNYVKQLTTLYQESANLGLRATLECQQSADKTINAWMKMGLESTQAATKVAQEQQLAWQQMRQEFVKQGVAVTNQAMALEHPGWQELAQGEGKIWEGAQKMTELFTAPFMGTTANAKR